ncbi:helix-turn-helix transcriptional regulator [Actinomadura rugatobispora]|uniref:AraC family transcriptional regulator n=1 Tax=Actinomadura rugatobispora TaxID=1994 RepID=A0ABW1AIM9_9ACTN
MAEGAYAVEASPADPAPGAVPPPAERPGPWNDRPATAPHDRLGRPRPRPGGGPRVVRTASRRGAAAYQIAELRPEQPARALRLLYGAAEEDHRLLLLLGGRLVLRQGGAEILLAPGDGGLFIPAEPLESQPEVPVRGLLMTIPAHEARERLDRPLTRLDLTTGVGHVVQGMMKDVHGERGRLTPRQFDVICDRIVELLCLLADDGRPGVPGHLAEVESMVRRHVRAHAADPKLNGAAVARDLGWSLRQVQLALQQAGTTPRELIREERLRLVRERLHSPRHRHMTITELAHSSGFSSASALSTAFRQRYGISPRELRHETARRTTP